MRWLIVVGLAACSSADPPILRMTANPLALGATASGQLDGLADVTVDPEGIVSVTRDGDAIALVALAVGETHLTATRDDGQTAPRSIVVAAIDEVLVAPSLHDEPCTAPALFATGMRASLPYELRGGGQTLHGDVVPPLAAEGGMLDADTSTDGTVEVRMPDAAGTVTLTASSITVAELRAFSPAEVVALDVTSEAMSVKPLLTVDMTIDLVVDGRHACGDTQSRTVTVETPDICELADGSTSITTAGLSEVSIRGLRGGVCNVRFVLAGTDLTTTKTVTVTM